MAYLDFDVEDYLDEASDEAIRKEHEKRVSKKTGSEYVETLIPLSKKQRIGLLNDISTFLSLNNKCDWANKLDEIRNDYF